MQADLFPEQEPTRARRLDAGVPGDLHRFREVIWARYRQIPRPMPWRDDPNPYWVFVSEIMLQQTQVPRVIQKFGPFVSRFPDFPALAQASFSDVLAEWSGLGYNRRARFLHRAAGTICTEHDGVLPADPAVLVTLPGVGTNTAGSIAAFAYNQPTVFIETNIRRVFLHFFFAGEEGVHDRELKPIIEETLDRGNPREWYWALMDYGVALARSDGNANRRSRHYTRQTPFADSDRQLRGRILRLLTEEGSLATGELPDATGFAADRVDAVVAQLAREGMIRRQDPGRWVIAD